MPGRGRGRKGKGSKGEGEGEPSSATSTPSSSSSPRKSTSGEATPSASGSGPKPPVDKDATPEESPHDAKVEEDAEIFLTAVSYEISQFVITQVINFQRRNLILDLFPFFR